MFGRKTQKISWDRERQKPVIRASICNGEQAAGLKDIHSGKFTEIMLIRDDRDLKEFMKKCDISPEDITKEW